MPQPPPLEFRVHSPFLHRSHHVINVLLPSQTCNLPRRSFPVRYPICREPTIVERLVHPKMSYTDARAPKVTSSISPRTTISGSEQVLSTASPGASLWPHSSKSACIRFARYLPACQPPTTRTSRGTRWAQPQRTSRATLRLLPTLTCSLTFVGASPSALTAADASIAP